MLEFSIFDTLLEPVFVIDEKKSIHYCNESAASIAGLTSRKITRSKKSITDIFNFSDDVFSNLSLINEATPYKEVKITNSSGTQVIVQITTQRLLSKDPDLNNTLWILYFRDVTLEERLQNKYRSQLEQKEVVIEELKKAQKELERYSKNLEGLVQERTVQISDMNQTMMALLNSLNQGFLIFDESGSCLPIYSKTCDSIFESSPKGKKIWDLLKVPETKIEGVKKWIFATFQEMLPFDDLALLGPNSYYSFEKSIKIEYFPLRDENQKIKGIVVMATDITNLVIAKNEAENEKNRVKQILQVINNKKNIHNFYSEMLQLLELLKLESKKTYPNISSIKHILHTVKGNASLYSIKELVEVSHRAEDDLKNKLSNLNNFLEDIYKQLNDGLRSFYNNISKLLGIDLASTSKSYEVLEEDFKQIINSLRNDSKNQLLSKKLVETYLSKKIHILFEPFKNVIEETAVRLGKEVNPLIIEGFDIDVQNMNLSELFSTLVHCFRNSIDHGLEIPEVREKNGKSRKGTIKVITELSQDIASIKIIDDGSGIDPVKIRNKLKKDGASVDKKNDLEVIQHIFDESFSTKTEVSDISGRGVGLCSVKEAVLKLSGTITVYSTLNKGTTICILIPYRKEESLLKVS